MAASPLDKCTKTPPPPGWKSAVSIQGWGSASHYFKFNENFFLCWRVARNFFSRRRPFGSALNVPKTCGSEPNRINKIFEGMKNQIALGTSSQFNSRENIIILCLSSALGQHYGNIVITLWMFSLAQGSNLWKTFEWIV